MASASENAAVRRTKTLTGRMDPESLRTRGREDLADDFRRLDRRRLVAMPETDRDGFIAQLLAWFETGQGAPSFHTAEIIDTSGERLMLCRIEVSFPSGQTSELLQIYRYDEAVERLELVIAHDVEDVDAARREFEELAAAL
jgi:hypothetical protein